MYESVAAATGDALELAPVGAANTTPQTVSGNFRTVNAQSIAVIVGGKSSLTGTTWRAAYRFETAPAVTAVDLFDSGMADAYLSVFLRQPLRRSRVFPGGVDAIVNVRNLLAEGYRPFVTSDGSTLFFAQVDRSVQGGLAFYF
jgi:hypothetical protein